MDVYKVLNVNKKLFRPVPKVDSAVFKMTRKERVLSEEEEKLFIQIVKSSFHQKRKTLLNNLTFSFDINKEEVNELLNEMGISSTERAENIPLKQFIELTKKWKVNKV